MTAGAWERLGLLELVAANAADRQALTLGERSLSYGELVARAGALAGSLFAFGLRRGERVALLTRNRIEYFEVELGVAHAGGVLVAMSWRYSAEERLSVLRRSGAAVAIVDPEFAGELRAADLPGLRTIVEFGPGYDALLAAETPPAPVGRSPADPHEIIFTSGTTGEPKGAVWTTGGLIWNALQQTVDYGITPDGVTFVCFDLNYIGGRHQFVWALLLRGGTVHLKPSGGFDAAAVLAAIERHRVTHILLVPTMLREVLHSEAAARADTSSLRMIMCGGAPVSLELLDGASAAFPSAAVIQVYGLTEGGGSVTHVPAPDVRRKLGSAGRASAHAAIRIAGDDGAVLPAGSIGEIEVQAPTLCAGYWGDQAATVALFHDGWLRTGDLGRLDDEGYLFMTGRKKELIISGGMNVFPSEVETVLERHPAVRASAVFGVPDERWGERVCAAVELYDGQSVGEAELIELCRGALSGYKKPTAIVFVDALPRTISGKIAKRGLPSLLEAP